MTQNQTEEKSDPSLSTISLDEDLMQIGEPKSRSTPLGLTPLGDTSKAGPSNATSQPPLADSTTIDNMLPPKPPPPPPPPGSRPANWQIAILTIGVAVIVWYVAR